MTYNLIAPTASDRALSMALDAVAAMIGDVLPAYGVAGLRSLAVASTVVDLDPTSGPFVLHTRRPLSAVYPTQCYANLTVQIVSSYFIAPIGNDPEQSERAAMDLHLPILRAHFANSRLGLPFVQECLIDDFEGNTLIWGDGPTAVHFWGFKAIGHLYAEIDLSADWHLE